ncbi:hypothetical protein [Streptomyces sp. NPDC058861]|uniref:hypothetical protein n=1 Tax=Streptomyces sp. NPDC058861 TaxID=3346653 RepID=UPI00369C72D4
MPKNTTTPLAPISPQAVMDIFDHLRAVSVNDSEFAGALVAAEPRMPELIVDVIERIVVPVTAIGERVPEPCDESFVLDALASVFVTALRAWATAGPDTAEPLARTALHLIAQLLVEDHEDLAGVLEHLNTVALHQAIQFLADVRGDVATGWPATA